MKRISSLNSVRAAYDIVSEAYARKFVDELDHKPLDRELLQQFAATVGMERPVLDVGCGPGHTTAHLTSLGLQATGVDLSPKMSDLASRMFPQTPFEVGDFCSLRHDSSSVAGILAFYCIVHLQPDQLVAGFSEMHRVLSDGGVLLLSFPQWTKTGRGVSQSPQRCFRRGIASARCDSELSHTPGRGHSAETNIPCRCASGVARTHARHFGSRRATATWKMRRHDFGLLRGMLEVLKERK